MFSPEKAQQVRRRIFLHSAIWSAAFALLIGAALALGHIQPPPQILERLHLAECALPCWLGIIPGQTTFEEAVRSLSAVYPGAVTVGSAAGESTVTVEGSASLIARNGVIDSLEFSGGLFLDGKVTLGDIAIASLIGAPPCKIAERDMLGLLIYSAHESTAVVVGQHTPEKRWRNPVAYIAVLTNLAVCPPQE